MSPPSERALSELSSAAGGAMNSTRLTLNSSVYKTYWDGQSDWRRREWHAETSRKLYGVELNSRQMAWWRWKMHEGIKDDALMYQEFPPTGRLCFRDDRNLVLL
jgi:hypothetical protein